MPDTAGLPEEAVRAAAEAIWEGGIGPIKSPEWQAKDALTAALPHLRDTIAADVREQVAREIEAYNVARGGYDESAIDCARIARTPQRSDTEGKE